jgi:antagonist of KipI
MQLRVVKPGLLTTVQDLGRKAGLPMAVPFSGAMDSFSARTANFIVGNPGTNAVLEITLGGAAFSAVTDLLIGYAGNGAHLNINGQFVPAGKPVFIPKGTHLTFIYNAHGSRTYLAIAGGFDVPDIIGSKSTCLIAAFGGFNGRALQQHDVLNALPTLSALSVKILTSLKGDVINYPSWQVPAHFKANNSMQTVRVIPSKEFTWFNGQSIASFLTEPFKLTSRSNRMGYQLEGPPMVRVKNEELLSTAVVPGTMQVTNNGSIILLMADCQTTGGYPRIAQVAAADLPLCGQLHAGDALKFEEISWSEAETLYIEQEKQLQRIASVICNKYL